MEIYYISTYYLFKSLAHKESGYVDSIVELPTDWSEQRSCRVDCVNKLSLAVLGGLWWIYWPGINTCLKIMFVMHVTTDWRCLLCAPLVAGQFSQTLKLEGKWMQNKSIYPLQHFNTAESLELYTVKITRKNWNKGTSAV